MVPKPIVGNGRRGRHAQHTSQALELIPGKRCHRGHNHKLKEQGLEQISAGVDLNRVCRREAAWVLALSCASKEDGRRSGKLVDKIHIL